MKNESFEPENNIEPEKIPEKATDMELALFLMMHIDDPCEAKVEPEVMENIREFYIKEAEKNVKKMTNISARELLEEKIKEYKKDV